MNRTLMKRLLVLALAACLLLQLPVMAAADGEDGFTITDGYLVSYTGSALSVTIPDSVTQILSEAFNGVTSLRSVTIPAGVNYIESYAFYNCSNLTEIYFLGDPGTISSTAFMGCGKPTVHAKKGSNVESYCLINSGFPFVPTNPKPDSVSLDTESLTVDKGGTRTVTASFTPEDAWTELTWESSDPNVASVQELSGSDTLRAQVTARAYGTAVITARTAEGLSATAQVRVPGPQPTYVYLSEESSFNMLTGETKQLSVTFYPTSAESLLTWSSSDPEVATVDETGLVTALKAGTTTIKVLTENGKSDTAKLTVKMPDLESIRVSETGTVRVVLGKKKQLTAEPVPANAWFEPKWSSDDESVATVDETGKITPVSPGTAIIEVESYRNAGTTSWYSLISTTLVVEVVRPDAKTVTLNKKSPCTLYLDKTLSLKATVKPSLADKAVTWSSSKPSVASVDETGKVTPLKAGTAVITATAASGVSASLKVKVKAPQPTKITLEEKGSVYLEIGKTLKLHPELTPSVAEKKLTWTSSDTSVARVNKDGKVIGLKKGTATVTVKTKNGKKASVKIRVYDPKKPDGVSIAEGEKKKVYVGMKVQLTAEQKPSVCTSPVTWSSSDPSVVTVDKKGKITAKKAGAADVTVTTKNGKSASIRINVARNIADNLRKKPHFSDISYGQEIFLKSVEIVSENRVDCEYYLVFNHISGLTTKWFSYIKATITAGGETVCSGLKEFVPIRLRSPGVALFKISFTGKEVVNTNVNLNAVDGRVYSSDKFYLEWNY